MPNEHIQTKSDLINHLEEIRKDFEKNGSSWENNDLPNYLEAFQSFVEAIEGYYKNRKENIEEMNTWRVMADCLSAARIYE
ncbi:hypothetical protein [Pelagicoccus sp. SDUM812003]|uniref:DUF7660 family protein n=1 Tax=Pelagicoccus sp. SDUM812003 TaxID=3041267 RepID=UPI00280E88B7|nr:hypothetical protein [Pelagicoccus sp. SDUM812003]MDQ8203971.1 hypothetical protein [Pelagicoccus sp. SDUM812003]